MGSTVDTHITDCSLLIRGRVSIICYTGVQKAGCSLVVLQGWVGDGSTVGTYIH